MARLGCPGSAPSALPASPTTFGTSLLPATAAAAPPTTPAATFVALAFFSGLICSPFSSGGLEDDPGAADVPPSLLDTCHGGCPSSGRPSWGIGIIFGWDASYTGNAPARLL